jgi:phosphoglycolate phosphatase
MTKLLERSTVKVILWDIDGTLLRSKRSGEFINYLKPILLDLFGTFGDLGNTDISGMTDLQIIYESVRCEGFSPKQIIDKLPDLSVQLPQAIREAVARGEAEFYLLPGVVEALQALDIDPRYRNAMLTGNIEPAAEVKLELVGLERFFKLPGAFGSDSMNRLELPAVAARRLNATLGLSLLPEDFIVIGDTPNDVACARYFGAHAIAIATGRSYDHDALAAHAPDAILPDLSDLDLLFETLANCWAPREQVKSVASPPVP